MRVVLDTNVLLVSISRKSRHHPIFNAILDGSIELCISNAILEEYQEIIGREWSPTVAENITEVLLKSPSVLRFDPHYNWVLIKDDPDDDKFADCAVASSAYFLVTDDGHFKVLKDRTFPPINVISAEDFLDFLEKRE